MAPDDCTGSLLDVRQSPCAGVLQLENCTDVASVEQCHLILVYLLKQLVCLETDLEDVEVCHVQCTVEAFMYHPAEVADAIHEAVEHPNESQCGDLM